MGFVHVLPTLHLVISITDHTYAQATLNNGGDEVQVQVDLLVIKRIKIHSYQLSNNHFHQFLHS